MKSSTFKTARGQVLLISITVLGFLTLGFVILGIATTSQASQSAAVRENKLVASAAATACMEQALDRLGLNAGYAGNEMLAVGAQVCTVRPVIIGSGLWTLETSAQTNDQYARYRVILTSRTPITIQSWNEVAGF